MTPSATTRVKSGQLVSLLSRVDGAGVGVDWVHWKVCSDGSSVSLVSLSLRGEVVGGGGGRCTASMGM